MLIKNGSFFPITNMRYSSPKIQHIFYIVNSIYNNYMDIDSNIWQPFPVHISPLKLSKMCVCGMPLCTLKPCNVKLNGETRNVKGIAHPNSLEHIYTWSTLICIMVKHYNNI